MAYNKPVRNPSPEEDKTKRNDMGNGVRLLLVTVMTAVWNLSLAGGSGVSISVGVGYSSGYGYGYTSSSRGYYGSYRYRSHKYGSHKYGYRHGRHKHYRHGYGYRHDYKPGYKYGYKHGYGRYGHYGHRTKLYYGYRGSGYGSGKVGYSTVYVINAPGYSSSDHINRYYYRDEDLYYAGSRPIRSSTDGTRPRVKLLKDRNGDCFEIRNNSRGEEIYVVQDTSRCDW